MLKYVILDGVQSFENKKKDKLFVVHMNIWRLRYFSKKNKQKKQICGLLVYYYMNCCMVMLLFKGKEWIKFCCKFKRKKYHSKNVLVMN